MDPMGLIVFSILGLFAAYLVYILLGSRKAIGTHPALLFEQYPDLTQENAPVLIYCYGSNCSACRSMAPNIDAIEKADHRVIRVDISQDPQLAGELGVRVIPTCLILKSGKISHTALGSKSEKALEKLLHP